MKKASKFLMTTVLLYCAFVLVGCSNAVSDSPSKVTDTSSANSIIESNMQSTFDSSVQINSETAESDSNCDSIIFDDFKISIDTDRAMNIYTIDNQFSELNGRKVYAVPMTIENTGSETKGINMFYVKSFGSHGTELDSVYAYFAEAQDFYKEMRPGAKIQTAFYIPDDGSGEYCIVFKNFTEEKELLVNIA
ncbi:MAG: hypothetical protein K2N38_03170 [Oscillospiraceae bacterium]|nr:hypothetical protein [Oscillospiraceae bacterium]